jgi:hypothetical protein
MALRVGRMIRDMALPAAQRGFVAIVGVVLVLVIGLMVATLGRLTSNDNLTGTLHLQSQEALFAARSGIDYAGSLLGRGVACGSLPTAAQTVGGSSFTITAGTLSNTSTTLSAAIGTADSMLPLTSGVFASHGLVTIGGEDIQYGSTGIGAAACGAGVSFCLLGATRGHNGSTAATAISGATVSQLQCLVRSTGTATGSPSATRVVEASFRIRNPAVTLPQAMMVYSKGGIQMFSRVWNPLTGGWGAEYLGPSVTTAGRNIHHLRLALSRTRDEAVVAVETITSAGAGHLYATRWNGATWRDMAFPGTNNSMSLLNAVGATMTPLQAYSRGIDVVYQTANDIAIFAYDSGGSASPSYATFNGVASWTTGGATNVGTGAGTQDIPLWIELAANPNPASNEVALITLQARENASQPEAVRASAWSGAAWPATASSINAGATLGRPSNANHRKAVAVAYESVSGRAMYAWSDNVTAGKANYIIATGNTINVAATSTTIAASTGIGEWLRLTSHPESNKIMLTLQSANRNLDTLLWDGSAWSGAHPQHDATTQSATEKNFEFTFENHPSSSGWGWLVWGDGVGISRRRFEGGGTGSAIQSVVPASGAPTVNYVDVRTNPLTGRLLDGLYAYRSSSVTGIWTSTRQGAIRDATNKFNPLGWYSPPMVAPVTNGLATNTVGVVEPSGSRVAVEVRASGASLIEMQEMYP